MPVFDYAAPAEIFGSGGFSRRRHPIPYRRFDTGAEAVRFAVEEEFPRPCSPASLWRRTRTGLIMSGSGLSTIVANTRLSDMTQRTSRRSVAFRAPFFIEGVEGVHPAGTYVVDTDEALLEELSFTAYRRVSTSIVIPLPGSSGASYQRHAIAPSALEAAESRDRES